MDDNLRVDDYIKEILDSMTDLICVVTPELNIVYINQIFCRYFAVEKNTLDGSYLLDTVLWKEKIEVCASNTKDDLKAILTRMPLEVKISRDNSDYFFLLESTQLPRSNNMMIKWHDVTSLKTLRKELNESLIKYNTLSMFTSFASAVMDSKKRIFIAGNDQMLDLFGFTIREEFHNYDLLELSPKYQPDGERSSEKAIKMMGMAIENGSNTFDWRHTRLDGTEFDINVQLTAFGDQSEIMFTVFRPTKEISRLELEKKQQELENLVQIRTEQLNQTMSLLTSNYEAKVSNQRIEAINQILVGVAHEINTPLGTCITLSSYVKKRLERLRNNYLDGHMTKILFEDSIEELTDASNSFDSSLKIAVDKFNQIKESLLLYPNDENQTFKLEEIISSVIALNGFDKNINEKIFSIDIKGDGIIYGNQNVFYQIILELINNAIEHSGFEADALKISFGLSTKADYHEVKCFNNGNQIQIEDKESILNPFFSTKKNKGKIGIGLYFINNAIREMGGSVYIDDVDDGFSITLNIPK